MVFKLATIDKEPMVEGPPIIYQPMPKPSKLKKYIIIGSFTVITAALIMIAVLVGIYIYTEAQKDIIKFTLKLDVKRSQDVTSDIGSNIVQYFVRDDTTTAWIVNDFNTDIKVTKIMSGEVPGCYITPLNRSTAMEPSKVTKPDEKLHEPSQHDSVIYQISGEPVRDISFLNTVARRMCSEVPTYWMYPICYKTPAYNPDKMDLVLDMSPFYMLLATNQNGTQYPCVRGCCKTVCACEIKYTWMVIGDKIICNWITKPCCSHSHNCFYKSFCSDTKGLSCQSNCK